MKCRLFWAALVAAGVIVSAQEPPSRPTFRTGTDAVVIDVRVVDRSGQFIRDLTKDELRVFEDGQEQIISTFELVDMPYAPLSQTRSVAHVDLPSDVTSNTDANQGRLYVIVLDDYNPPPLLVTSDIATGQGRGFGGGPAPPLPFPAQQLAREMIFHMSAGDRAAVVTSAGRRDMAQEFTSDRQRLLAVVDGFVSGRSQSEEPPRSMMRELRSVPGPFDTTHDVMTTLKDVANWLAGVPARRKSIILISHRMGGLSASLSLTNFSRAAGLQNVGLAADMRKLVEATSRANVSIYTLSNQSGHDPINPLPLPDEWVLGKVDRNSESRMTIAQATGGFSRALSFDGVFERIAAETGSYYLLGYTPATKDNGKFHRIEVRTTRQELAVRTRAGYYSRPAPPLKPSMIPRGMAPSLVQALQSPASIAGLPMSMSVVPFRGRGSRAFVSIALEIDEGKDSAAISARPSDKPIQIAMAAAKADGKVAALRTIAVPGGTVVARMELGPGRYHFRVGAWDTADDRRGSLLYDIDVPDFSKNLTMSGIVIGSSVGRDSGAGQQWVSGSDVRWKNTLSTPPTTRRVFSPDEELTGYVEVYAKKAGHQIDVTMTVRNADGEVVYSQRETSTAKGSPALHQIKTTIPLTTLGDGAHVLQVEASDRGSSGVSLSRSIPFAISMSSR